MGLRATKTGRKRLNLECSRKNATTLRRKATGEQKSIDIYSIATKAIHPRAEEEFTGILCAHTDALPEYPIVKDTYHVFFQGMKYPIQKLIQ